MSDGGATADAVAGLRSTATIRARCARITHAVDAGRSPHFTLARERLADVADRIAALTRKNHPTLRIPYHSRWRHFEAGGVDRKAELDARLAERTVAEQARARIDLTVVSVLLDAGAGPGWRYREDGAIYSRSEGLGVASFRAFLQGRFSSDAADPLRADAAALQAVSPESLAAIFQADGDNPLLGLAGRAALLRRLGDALSASPAEVAGRPGSLFDALRAAGREPVTAARLLRRLLDALSGIWPAGQQLNGVPLGDVWQHPEAGGHDARKDDEAGIGAGWVPFHKLSQWLAYSLLEPFEWAGVPVGGLDELTGLPEYRNGGLLLDAGVIVPRDAAFAERLWQVHEHFIVEWRALTVTLLDELAPMVRERLGVTPAQLPLACMLEGGSWAAGRQIAAERRPGGGPPLAIASDGTVF